MVFKGVAGKHIHIPTDFPALKEHRVQKTVPYLLTIFFFLCVYLCFRWVWDLPGQRVTPHSRGGFPRRIYRMVSPHPFRRSGCVCATRAQHSNYYETCDFFPGRPCAAALRTESPLDNGSTPFSLSGSSWIRTRM